MRAYDIAACVVAGGGVAARAAPLGETTEKGLYVDPSATFSQTYRPSTSGSPECPIWLFGELGSKSFSK